MEYGFFDNQLIGVDALNSITQKIVSGGIARVPSSVGDLNGFLTDVVTNGVVPDSDTALKVSIESNVVNIAPGTAFFENGTFAVLKETESLTLPTEFDMAYVYLVSSMDEMRVFAAVETSERDNENGNYCLLLATVNDENEVVDCRKYAKGKAAYYGSADINNNVDLGNITLPSGEEKKTYVIDVTPDLYENIIIRNLNDEALCVVYLEENIAFSGYYSRGDNRQFICANLEEGCVIGYYNGSTWSVKLTINADNITLDFNQDDFYGGAFSAAVEIKLIAKKV